MEPSEVAQALGALGADVRAVNNRLTDHIIEERARDDVLFKAVKDIQDTLSQAIGAKRLLVWVLGALFAAIALAKGWVFPSK